MRISVTLLLRLVGRLHFASATLIPLIWSMNNWNLLGFTKDSEKLEPTSQRGMQKNLKLPLGKQREN